MISLNTITKIAEKEEVSWIVVEKDYFLTLLLDGISHSDFLRKNLIFKGGTALRKICFRHYRYSEDLDFTLIKTLSEKEVKREFEEVFAYLKKEYNADFRIKEIYSEGWFHDIKIQFTGLKGMKNTIAVDLLSDELIVDVRECEVLNQYYEKRISLKVYSIEEILAEKLRSLLQRTRVRDYYDVWYILHQSKKETDMERLKEIFKKKIKYRKIDFNSSEQFFEKNKIDQAKAYYQRQIAHQMKKSPEFDELVRELKKSIKDIFD